MAGDWIKMRSDLYRDPKVCVMADLLLNRDSPLARYVNQNEQRDMTVTRNVTRNATVGALVSVWGVLRHRGKRDGVDLVIKGCTATVIDDLADIPGFGEAMKAVGWLVETSETLVLPRFFGEFNVSPEEEKGGKCAERQRRYREKKKAESDVTRDVTVAPQSNAREEKRREEYKNPLTPKGDGVTVTAEPPAAKTPPAQSPTGFARFWKAWPSHPRKTARSQCEAKWVRGGCEDIADQVITAVQRAKISHDWTKDGGQFIPAPLTWLNQRRWEAPPVAAPPPEESDWHPVTPDPELLADIREGRL